MAAGVLAVAGLACNAAAHGSWIQVGSAVVSVVAVVANNVGTAGPLDEEAAVVPASGPTNPDHGGRELDELGPLPCAGACGQNRRR